MAVHVVKSNKWLKPSKHLGKNRMHSAPGKHNVSLSELKYFLNKVKEYLFKYFILKVLKRKRAVFYNPCFPVFYLEQNII